MTCARLVSILLLVLGFAVTEAAAQQVTSVDLRYSGFRLSSGVLGSYESYAGAGLVVRFQLGGAEVALSSAYVPERGVRPGWLMGGIALPVPLLGDQRTGVSVRFGAGFHHMIADQRRALMRECTLEEGCMFEAEGYATGWSTYGSVGLDARVHVYRGLALGGGAGVMRLMGGRNRGEVMVRWKTGLSYTF